MMQFIKTVARHIIILILPCFGYSQSTYLPQGSQYEHFLDRIGIKMQTNPDLNIFTVKPLSRKVSVQVSEMADSISAVFPEGDALHLGKTDQDNAHSLLMNNSEWVTGSQESFKGKTRFLIPSIKHRRIFLRSMRKIFFSRSIPCCNFNCPSKQETTNRFT